MDAGFTGGVPFGVIMGVAAAMWFVAVYSIFAMLRHVRGGRWFRLLFQIGWWDPRKVHHYIDPPGIPHYHRLKKAIMWFLFAVFCGMSYGLLQIYLRN